MTGLFDLSAKRSDTIILFQMVLEDILESAIGWNDTDDHGSEAMTSNRYDFIAQTRRLPINTNNNYTVHYM